MKRFYFLVIMVLCISFTAVFAETGTDEQMISYIPLNSGYEIPQFGISFAGLSADRTEELIYAALLKGFRMISMDGSASGEEGAGCGIQKAIEEGLVKRDEIFISIPFSMGSEENCEAAIQKSLERLNLEYVDLMVLWQNDFPKDVEAWQSMEQGVETGLIRSIGLAGFVDVRNFDLFVNNAVTVQPSVLQIPIHPYEQRQDMREHLADSETVLVSDSPLGGDGEEQVLFADPLISMDATWHRKTSPQIILRWQLQCGNVILPEITDEAQIDEYFEVLDFELTEEEMEQINALDKSLNLMFY